MQNKLKLKALAAVLFGTIVEWYDYALYGYMTAVLSKYFFPSVDPTTAMLKQYSVFAVGFIAKPIGAYIFGHIGDIYGRRYALRWSTLGIALPTAIIGCLPSYQQAGILSVVGLCMCRLLQGLFISAEKDGVDIFIYESWSKQHACLANSFSWISSSIGTNLACYLAGLTLKAYVPEWGWRAPFWLAGIMGLCVVWIRKYLIESQDYRDQSSKALYAQTTNRSYWATIWENKRAILTATLLQGAQGSTYFFYFLFWCQYLSGQLNLFPMTQASKYNSGMLLISTIVAPLCGWIGDFLGIKRAAITGGCICIFLLIVNGLSLQYYGCIPTSLILITSVVVVGYYIPAHVLILQLFKLNQRYRCMSLGHALGSMIFSSTTPAVCIYLWKRTGHPNAPVIYCVLLLVMGILAAIMARPVTSGLSISKNN